MGSRVSAVVGGDCEAPVAIENTAQLCLLLYYSQPIPLRSTALAGSLEILIFSFLSTVRNQEIIQTTSLGPQHPCQ